MSVDADLARLTSMQSKLATARAQLTDAETVLTGAGAQQSEEEAADSWLTSDVTAATLGGIGGIAGAISFKLGRTLKVLRDDLDVVGKVDKMNLQLFAVKNASNTGETIAQIGSLFPGGAGKASGSVKKALDLLGANSDNLLKATEPTEASIRALIKTKEFYKDIASGVGLAAGTVGGAIKIADLVAQDGEEHGGAAAAEANRAASTFKALPEDARVTAAFAELADRYELSVGKLTEIGDKAAAFVEPIEDAAEKAVEALKAPLAAIDDAVEAVQPPIEGLAGLEAAATKFTSALGIFTKPFDALFNFLANPPSIPNPVGFIPGVPKTIKLFPAIARSEIQKVLDFLENASGVILAPLNLVLNPILKPIENAVSGLLNDLFPTAAAKEAFDKIKGLVDDLAGKLGPVTAFLDDLRDRLDKFLNELGVTAPEYDAPGETETRETYFGGDAAEFVVGAPRGGAPVDEGPGDEGPGDEEEEGEGDVFVPPVTPLPMPQAFASQSMVAASAASAETEFAGAILSTGGGDDTLVGTALADFLLGGAGDDEFRPGEGDDVIGGGSGVDTVVFSGVQDDYELVKTSGALEVAGPDGAKLLAEVEILRFLDGDVLTDSIVAIPTNGDDSIVGTPGDDEIEAGGGDDLVVNLLGSNRIDGGDGNDRLITGAGDDTILGGAGDDIVKTGDGDDDIDLGDGDDLVLAGNGDDTILGGDGNDIIKPGRGDDEMDGGAGDDILVAFRGDEVLIGGEGNDTLLGNLDDDTLIGGAGDDRMQGGPGRDVFVFDTPEFGHDRIVLDFRPGSDTLDFSGSGLTRADLAFSEVAGKVKITVTGHDSSIVLDSSRTGDLTIAQFNDDTLIF